MVLSVKELIMEELVRTQATVILSELTLKAINKMDVKGSQIDARKKEITSILDFSNSYIEELDKYICSQKWNEAKK